MTPEDKALAEALAGFSSWAWLGYEARALRGLVPRAGAKGSGGE